MRIVPSLAAVLVLSLSAAAQEMQERHEKKAKHESKRDDDPKAVKARWCEECRAFIDRKDLADKHRCPACKKVARNVETTMVKVYACERCGRRTECPRECCGAPVKEASVRAAVLFKCESCGRVETQEGPCPSPGCKKSGRTLVRTVELPHDDHSEK